MHFILESGHYENDINLPRIHGGGQIIIDGGGGEITLGPNSNGFCTPTNNPLTDTSTRYHIRNLTIKGGKRAINIFATFGSTVEYVNCIGQSDVAINMEFALMSFLNQVMVTNPKNHGIILQTGTTGSWVNNRNSQCNASILQQCRVYNNGNMTGNSFTILNSNGVQIKNCISEGWSNDGWALYFSGNNAWTKGFDVDEFHVEHGEQPKAGCIYIASQANVPVSLKRLFMQNVGKTSPAVKVANNSVVIFEKIGWWTPNMEIELTHDAPRIRYRDCHPTLNNDRLKFDGHIKTFLTHTFP